MVSNALQITVHPKLPPAIEIQASATKVCTGDTVQFTATATNGGTEPLYQWIVNGKNTGSNSSLYTANNLKNNDSVSCTIQSNAVCATSSAASSNSIIIAVSNVRPSVLISASDTAVCKGEEIHFTAAVSTAVGSPTYEWMINGNRTGATTASFVFSNILNNDTVLCKVNDSASCSAYSNPLVVKVYSNPEVIFSSDYTINASQPVMLTPFRRKMY